MNSAVCHKAQNNLRKAEIASYKIAFQRYDADGSGSIDAGEIEKVVRAACGTAEVSKADVEAMLAQADMDRDDEIDFDEFCILMDRKEHELSTVFGIGCLNCNGLFSSPDGSTRTCPACVKKTGSKKVECVECHVIFTSGSGKSKHCLDCRNSSGSSSSKLKSRPAAQNASAAEAMAITYNVAKNARNERNAQLASYSAAFSAYDADGSGEIDILELCAVLNDLSIPASKKDSSVMMNLMDVNRSGTLDFEEFCALIDRCMPEATASGATVTIGCINCLQLFSTQNVSLRTCTKCEKKEGSKRIECVECHAIFSSVSGRSKRCIGCRKDVSNVLEGRREVNAKRAMNAMHQIAFDRYDQDGSGFIESFELRNVLAAMGLQKTPAECDAMVKELDANGNGKLDFEEYTSMMSSRSGEVSKLLKLGCLNCNELFKPDQGPALPHICHKCDAKKGSKKVICHVCVCVFNSGSGTTSMCLDCRDDASSNTKVSQVMQQARMKSYRTAFQRFVWPALLPPPPAPLTSLA